MDNIDLKSIWNQKQVIQPNIDELLLKLDKFKQSKLRKLILTNVLLIATCAFVLFIWYYFQPQYLTTKIGIVLTVLSMLFYIFYNNKMFSTLKSMDEMQSNVDYLDSLKLLKTKELQIQTKILNIYFILLSIGIGLYMYEYTSKMMLMGGIMAYLITGIWFAINWFLLRPKVIKKEQAKIEVLIQKFDNMNKQLKEVSN